MAQVVVAEACTSPAGGANAGLLAHEGQCKGSTPFSQGSPAKRTVDGARRTAHHHVQVRDDEGGQGAHTFGQLAGAFAIVDPIDGAVDCRRVVAGKERNNIRNVKGRHHAAR